MLPDIFLFGRAGAGKTKAAHYLRERHGYSVIALADPIKRECSKRLGRNVTKHDRSLLIEYGQSFRRWFGEDVWCVKAAKTVDGVRRFTTFPRRPFIIEDGRHEVEYDFFVARRGFTPVRITAPDDVRDARLIARDGVDQREVLAGHEDELDLAYAEYEIVNDGSDINDLYRQLDEMVAYFERIKRGEA